MHNVENRKISFQQQRVLPGPTSTDNGIDTMKISMK